MRAAIGGPAFERDRGNDRVVPPQQVGDRARLTDAPRKSQGPQASSTAKREAPYFADVGAADSDDVPVYYTAAVAAPSALGSGDANPPRSKRLPGSIVSKGTVRQSKVRTHGSEPALLRLLQQRVEPAAGDAAVKLAAERLLAQARGREHFRQIDAGADAERLEQVD